MGLTIHYSLQSDLGSAGEARRLLDQLRRRALDLPFQRVGESLDLTGRSCDFQQCPSEDPNRWLLIQASQSVEHKGFGYRVIPRRILAFCTWPGEGCEPANFGLCRYPRTTVCGRAGKVPTGLPAGWSWRSFCKTQYASNPDLGGVQNFLRCHLSVIRLLDEAKALGLDPQVSDEGGHWEKRDVQALARAVGNWNQNIAGLVGQMKDLLGERRLQSQITRFSNFEHLEAQRRARETAAPSGTRPMRTDAPI